MKVLIICTGNTCRSPMAEGIFKSLIKKNNLELEVSSAGIYAFDGDNAAQNAIKALEKMGVDISNHKSTLVHHDLIDKADLILTMTNSHKESIIKKFPESKSKVFLLNEYAYDNIKDVGDPYGGSLRDYEMARDEIYKAVEEIIKKFTMYNWQWTIET